MSESEATETGTPVVLLGWDGLEAIAVRLEVRDPSITETRAHLHAARKGLADDFLRAPVTTREFPNAGAAQEAIKNRIAELQEQGMDFGAEPLTLESFASLPPLIEQHLKTVLVPDPEGDQEILTRFGGLPRLAKDALWPACGCCENPLSFLGEIELPSVRESTQLFICLHGGRAGSCVPRVIVHSVDLADAMEREAFPHTEVFGETVISNWKTRRELPSAADHRRLGLRAKRPSSRPVLEAHFSGTKIGGWPTWGEFPERPICEACCKPMTLELQTLGIPPDLLWGAPVGHIQVFRCVPCDRRLAQHVPPPG